MIQAYSINVTVAANEPIPFNNIQTLKGCNVNHNSAATFELNRSGLYEITCETSAAAAATIQLYVDGVAQAATARTGENISITHTVVVPANNSRYAANTSPVTVQAVNTGSAEATFTAANIVISQLR